MLRQFIIGVVSLLGMLSMMIGQDTRPSQANVGVSSRPRSTALLLGVHIHPDWTAADLTQFNLAQISGTNLIRIGASWRLLEPTNGNWNTAWYVPQLDNLVAMANERGMQIFFMLADTPCWASSSSTKDCSHPDDNIDSFRWCPPVYDSDYAEAIRYLATRYSSNGVKAYEVWNEPNNRNFWCDSSPSASRYVDILQVAYTAIKAVQPDAIVLGGSLAGSDTTYLEAMYTAGAQGYFDALALHPYSGTASPDDCADLRWSYKCGVENIRTVMVDHSDTRPIWFTEFGWSSLTGDGGVGEILQSSYLSRALELARGWSYVPVAIWYNLLDVGSQPITDREAHFGLFRVDFSPKPAAFAYHHIALPYTIFLPLSRK